MLNILLAEDDPSNQLLMQKMLNLAGHKVTIAENGQAALNKLKMNTYDVCIFDMQMPEMTGIEAIVTYKNENSECETPFIMLTGSDDKNIIDACLESGVDMFLTKPIKSQNLIDAINQVVNLSEINKEKVETDQIIDITKLHNYQDQNFLDEFIEIFKLSADKFITNLNNSLHNDYENFKIATHSIKGLSANIGAQTLREISSQAEGLSKDDYEIYSNEYAEKIIAELLKARDELIKFSSKIN